MDAKIIAVATPFFFLLIGVEILWTRGWKDRAYRLYDSISNLSCGIGQQAIALLLHAIIVGGYVAVHARFAATKLDGWIGWIVAILGVDLAYYWFHRVSHRARLVWATHAVHHQSEEYNLSVALRQSWFQQVMSAPFYWPLALIGIPPVMFVTAHTIDTVYQFWIHTRAIKNLGPLELVFNTPSHHRVHHGIDPKYIDKNYAGMLIVWDKLFGTFQREEEEPTYGTVKPLASFNPTWANLEPWLELWGMRSLRALFMPPEWTPRGPVKIPETSRAAQRRYDARAPRHLQPYVLLLFTEATLAAIALLTLELLPPTKHALIAFVLLTLTTLAGFVERKVWAFPLESLRLGLSLGAVIVLAPSSLPWSALVALAMVAWLRWLRMVKPA